MSGVEWNGTCTGMAAYTIPTSPCDLLNKLQNEE